MRCKLLAVLAISAVLTACGGEATAPTSPASTVPSLPIGRTVVATARRRGQIEAEALTGPDSIITLESPRHISGDPGAEVPLVLVVREQISTWLQVILPVRPNGTIGLVPAADFTLSAHDFRIDVRLNEFRLRAYKGDQLLFEAPIGVAKESTPTPGGNYYTTELVQPLDPNGLYGPYAYGLSGFSDVHQSFAGGPGQLGIHGTNQPELVGGRVSNGCIRLKNDDITALVKLGLPLGTPVNVRS